jgi:hypothetical protein
MSIKKEPLGKGMRSWRQSEHGTKMQQTSLPKKKRKGYSDSRPNFLISEIMKEIKDIAN